RSETPAEIDQPLLYESFNLPDIQCSVPQSASSSTGVERENTESADIAPRRRFQSDFQRHASLRAVIEATHRRLADGFDEMQLAMSSADEMPMPVPWRLGDVDIGAQFESTATLRAEQRLLVFGGPTSGKSGLINRLLGEDIMPIGVGSLLLCQAGLTHLHFSERPFVRFSGSAFPNQPPVELDPSRPLAGQVRTFLLSDDFEPQRSAWASMDGCALEIGAPMELMRCQLAFVEVPSDCVDHLVRERLLRELARSKNHTVVYVIDSQKGFCNQQSDEICSVHRSGEETQQRKLRLVNDQLLRYRLVDPRSGVDGRARSVFPISLIRLRVPLTASGSKSLVHRLNRQYRVQYGELQEALFSNLLETSSAGVDGAIGLLFLKASLAFDAFARDPAKEEAESRGPAAKDLVRIAVSEARDAIEQLKRKLKNDITKLHQACEESIISECGNLEFGPLRLHNRIRNNEVEQQYRTQLHNFALHLLNSEVSSRLVDCLANLRSSLALLIGKMQSQLTKESTEAGGFVDSQWNEVVRLQTQEAQCVAARMDQLSIEWEGDFKFFTWMRRLVAKKGQASGGAVFSTSEWKESVAKDFYQHINLSAVVKKFFANLEAKLLQTERRLQGLAASRQRCGTRLRRLLRKNHPGACAAWRAAQRCLATADALRNAQRFGLVDLGEVLYDGRLGCQRALVREDFGGSCVPGLQAATVLRPDGHLGSICSLYLGQRRQRRWLLPNEWTVAPILHELFVLTLL
uniref:G domain-containing protein n=1 Tax=Macrostomum lignano TaxID=282301 RepID=A0A1I8IN21_9PLAT